MSFKINDGEITKKLEEIRRRVRGVEVPPIRIDKTVIGKDVESLFHFGFLVKDGNPVLVYIKDHSDRFVERGNMERHKKLHFTVCEKLREMKREGNMERYHMTNRYDKKYLVSYGVDSYGNEVTDRVSLLPCEFCLTKLDYRGFAASRDRSIKRDFNAREALDIVGEHLGILSVIKEISRGEYDLTYYADNHGKISRKFRKSKGFICQKCGVDLSEKPYLTDMHHVNGVKNDNVRDNLQCLCKLCHEEVHPHYHINPEHKSAIKSARKEQGINEP